MFLITIGLGGPLLVTSGLGNGGAPAPGFNLLGIVNTGTQLVLTFTEPLSLTHAAANFSAYTITGGPYPSVQVTSLSVSGAVLTLGTTLQHGGGVYTLHIPSSGFAATSAEAYVGTLTPEFTGVAEALGILMARMVDARTVEILFTRETNIWTAQAAANYLFSGTGAGHAVTVKKVDAITYRVTTSRQSVATIRNYLVSISGVTDTQGNPIS